ncbi:MAG: RidA family protein [Asticcacaulis sp.]|nr:RidA family protein [Asticcacaulis sp.]
MLRTVIITAALLAAAPAMAAPPVVHTGAAESPIASSVTVPPGYTTVYVSGMVPAVAHPDAEKGSIASFGTTEEQTESVLGKIEAELKGQGLTFKDVVQMRVYLAGDPAMGGKMDFAGMMKAYTRHFGTADQPNKPSRATIQVAALAAPGFLVEIEVVAVKPAV